MNTVQTTTYKYDNVGRCIEKVVSREELPGGDYLDLTGLNEEQIAHLVAIRDAFKATDYDLTFIVNPGTLWNAKEGGR